MQAYFFLFRLSAIAFFVFGNNFSFGQSGAFHFTNEELSLGQIKKNNRAKHAFSFVNNSSNSVKITRCSAACGCTIVNCPQGMIEPNEKEQIVVEFNSHRLGDFNKTITVYTNDKSKEIYLLKIKGKVIE